MKRCSKCARVLEDPHATHCPADGAPLEPVSDPLVGRSIGGRYRIRRRLGAGGMSTVYLAEHTLLGHQVALKVLRPDLTRDPVQRNRFLNEAKAIRRINHPNIVEVTDFDGGTDGIFYLVMEYVPGESLHARIQATGPMPSREALHIANQVTSALGRAHELGVIHRDLKPENVLIVRDASGVERVKVLDFGIAKVADFPTLTGSLQIIGTPGYIAPEYIRANTIDGRADLFSLGVVLYEMVTGGRHPYNYDHPGDLLVKPLTDLPVPPSERFPRVEPVVERLILRALQKEPSQRFRDAYHMRQAIEQAAAALPEEPPATARAAPPPAAPEPTRPYVLRPSEAAAQEPEPVEVSPERTRFGDLGREGAQPHGPRELSRAVEALSRAREHTEAVDTARDDEELGRRIARLEEALADAQARAAEVAALRLGLREAQARHGERADALAAQVSELAGRSEALAERRRALRAGLEPARFEGELVDVERELVHVQRRREAGLRALGETMEALDVEVEERTRALREALAALEVAVQVVERDQEALDTLLARADAAGASPPGTIA